MCDGHGSQSRVRIRRAFYSGELSEYFLRNRSGMKRERECFFENCSGIKKEREYFLRNRSGTKWERESLFENRSGTKAERERLTPFHSEPCSLVLRRFI